MFEDGSCRTAWRRGLRPSVRLLALDHAHPGPRTIAALSEYDVSTLPEHDQVVLLRAWERQRHWMDAQQQPMLAAVAGERDADGHDWGREEVAAALSLSKVMAARRIEAARVLTSVLDRTLDALAAGSISYRHATHLTEACAGLPVDVARHVESLALPRALGDGRRPGEGAATFRRTVQQAVIQADPAAVDTSRRATRSDRRVVMWPTAPGTATVAAEGLSADQAERVMNAIRMWSGKTGADDVRTHDQRMADALVDICDDALSRESLTPAKLRKVTTSLVMDLPTWAGLADNPAWLDGYGPIPAAMARELSAGGSLRRLVTDPQTGFLLDSSPHTYRPSEALRRYLVDRDRVCDAPHCNRPAVTCDVDHTTRWTDGGTTVRANLGPGCARDHNLRHEGRWRISREPDGTAVWTSPAGHTYRKPPWDYRPLE